jgi:hypothetical protein
LKNKNISRAAVTISTVVICDTKVLIFSDNGKYYFPSGCFYPKKETCQERASKIVEEALDYKHPHEHWIPVDIRSAITRTNFNGDFSLDLGYFTILDVNDIPIPVDKNYEWIDIDLDKKEFPVILSLDYSELWNSAQFMFELMYS